MQAGQLVLVRTNPATQFIAALAQNAVGELTMAMPVGAQQAGAGFVDGALGGGGTCRGRLRSITIASVEGLDWTVWFWGNSTFSDASPALAQLLGFAALPVAGAKRIAGAGLYYYFLGGLDIPIVDLEKVGQLYLGLQPTSAGKSAAGAGAIALQLAVEPTLGW